MPLTDHVACECPRCGGADFDEIDCGPDGYDDDVTWGALRCRTCGLWYSGWREAWLVDVESWRDEEGAEMYRA